MLTLVTFPASFGEPSHSPFCVKAMILLQMSGQNWQREDISDPSKMPYGKLPVLREGNRLIPDSEFIQDFLVRKDADFYPGYTDAQRALGHATIRLAEESLRPALVYDRWLDEQCWSQIWPVFFAPVPRPIRKFIADKARKNVRAGLTNQGIARMSSEDRLRKANSDLEALGQIIGDQDFILGKTATAADAAVLPVLSMIDRSPVETALTKLLRSKDWVDGYLQRARKALYDGLPISS